MIKINLLPVREARRRENVRELLIQMLLVALISGGALGLVHSRLTEHLGRASARVAEMEEDIEEFKPHLKQVAAFRSRKTRLEKKIKVINGLDHARTGPVRMFNELAIRTPERLWLTSLETRGTNIIFKGESLDNEIVAQFLRALNESAYFDNVDLDSTELGKKKKGIKLVSFHIHATTVTPGEASTGGAG